MTKKIAAAISACYVALKANDAWTATKYLSRDLVVKITRKAYGKAQGKPRRFAKSNARQNDFALTVGKPNFAERKFIKLCDTAGVAFPVRKIQLKFLPKK